ncbi:regulatory protein RecX [Sinomonas sp. G460-2]|uniref:regulatory protein RecX n=1 Tax=Sinomonas sp. G460-2 TaxID=3393464 RepID=UPI0039F0387D
MGGNRSREQEEDREPDPESVARAILLRQLTLGPRSRHQLAGKLRERNVPEETAEMVLERFEEVGLIDDGAFAAMWVRSRSESKSLSKSALRRELASKGIGGQTAEDALADLSDEDEDEAARRLVERRVRPAVLGDRATKDRELRRLVGMLARKGHPPARAFRIASDVLEEASRRSL